MDLLTQAWRNLQRLLAPDAVFSCGVLLVLLLLEIIGRRQALTDVHDFIAVLLLSGIAWLAVKKHQIAPLGWVTALGGLFQRAGEYLQQHYSIDIGIDLRGVPPLPRGLPRSIITATVVAAVEVVLLLVFAHLVPLGPRWAVMQVSYLAYLGLLLLVWVSLLGTIMLAMYIPFALIHDAFVTRLGHLGRRSQRLEAATLVSYFGCLLLAALSFPPWAPLTVCLLALAINLITIAIPSNPDVQFLWRYRSGDTTVRSIPWGLWVTFYATFLTLTVLDLVLLSAGSTVLGGESAIRLDAPQAVATAGEAIATQSGRRLSAAEVMPITTSLGLTLAWLAPCALTILMLQTILGRTRDPARPCKPVVHLSGPCPPPARKALQAYFVGQGWQVHWAPAVPDATEVCVELVEQSPADTPDGPRWPLPVSLEDLRQEKTLRRLGRRNEIQLRRKLLGGLERLFKLAASRKFRRGSGLWIAPHLWFIPGLTRDTPEEEVDLERGTLFSTIIGAPYHRILPRSVRHHAYVMLRALQVDLIFVEDGVSFKRFCRVLRMLFEIYDIHGGRRRADELHFSGLPGIRVVIHEFQLDEPFRSEKYPEPEFENLARARILHVFRDRGGEEELLETPPDFSFLPAPSGAAY
jgi:hypothetical protein